MQRQKKKERETIRRSTGAFPETFEKKRTQALGVIAHNIKDHELKGKGPKKRTGRKVQFTHLKNNWERKNGGEREQDYPVRASGERKTRRGTQLHPVIRGMGVAAVKVKMCAWSIIRSS